MSRPLLWRTCRVLSCRTMEARKQRCHQHVVEFSSINHSKIKPELSGSFDTGSKAYLSKPGLGEVRCGFRSSQSCKPKVTCASSIHSDAHEDSEETVFSGRTVEELQTWLEDRGIDTTLFGSVNGSKTLQCLLREVIEGESLLKTTKDGKPLRLVSIISVNIKNRRGQSLYETRQCLPGGGVRERNLLLSEKLMPNESWKDASRRGILEELGSILPENPEIDVLDDTYSKSKENSTSSSYPGLCTEYVCHKVEARVAGLPEADFVTEEKRPDGILLSSWAWRHATPL